jgi:hypothetical protein
MLGFEGALAHWAFDRGALPGHPGLVACVLIGSGRLFNTLQFNAIAEL